MRTAIIIAAAALAFASPLAAQSKSDGRKALDAYREELEVRRKEIQQQLESDKLTPQVRAAKLADLKAHGNRI